MIRRGVLTWSLVLFILSLFFNVSLVSARPPSAIKLDYEQTTKIFHINVQHVSSDLPEHRIRKIIIYKNDQEIKIFYYANQKPMGIIQDFEMDAKSGDTLKVAVFCTQSGPKDEFIVVPVPTVENTEEKVFSPADSIQNNNDHPSDSTSEDKTGY